VNLDNVRIALRGLLANRLRSSLTMLGILIGVAAVILLVAVGNGISALVQNQIESLGANAIYVLPERNRDSEGASRTGTLSRKVELTSADVKALANRDEAPDIVDVAPTVNAPVTAAYEGATYALQNFVGATPAFGKIRNAGVVSGRFFDEQDQADHAKVAVIGQTAAKNLFGPGVDPVGTRVQFNGVRFRIVGLLEKKGSNGFQDQDDVAIAPLSTVQDSLTGNTGSYSVIAVQAASRDRTNAAQAEVISIVRRTHRLGPGQPPDFVIFNQASLLATGKTAALVFTMLLAAIAAISLLVGGIGVMNIMLVTVTERTREIGIRKALGARRSDILGQFLVEAVLVSLLGGLLGVLVGLGGASLRLGALKPIVEPFSIVLAFGVSALVGVFFGLYPANRAASLTPIEALRHE
jgi:putative ABC transport system permease protein